ncbi:MAG: glycosyltransferase family 2 protein [Mesorhizobium sp.]|nr:MAG: glycosyltransferase family 2 protein [Mesorhizobium sp.]RWQ57028.1 MAG: glycosyltransferase family 2 protein [Mesorhizobium sp.]
MRLLVMADSNKSMASAAGDANSGFSRVAVLTSFGQPVSYSNRRLVLPMSWAQLRLGERTWRSRHRFRRAISEILGFDAARRLHWQDDIVSNVAACDPDVIDLRGLCRSKEWLFEFLSEQFPALKILVDSGQSSALQETARWRKYDPDTKITIVLPVYNGERFLRASLESCLCQTHRNLELIIVDDCSTDATPRIISEYAAVDGRIKVIRNTSNHGLPDSLNIGFRAATGTYFTWTSDDNLYAPGAIEYMAQQLTTYPSAGLVYTSFIRIDELGDRLGISMSMPPTGLRSPDLASAVVGACFMYRREVRDEIGEYRAKYRHAEDFDYWVRICIRYPALHYYEPCYFYRLHRDSLTSQHKAKWRGLNEKIVHEHFVTSRNSIHWMGCRRARPSIQGG